MAKLLINVGFSHMMPDVLVIAPEFALAKKENNLDREKKLPVMWLLHGFGGDCNDWSRYGSLELLAREKNMFIICPSANNSYYINGGPFMNFYKVITEDLYDFVMRSFPVSSKPEDNYVVGNGMGGYGAVLFALKNPDKFGHAASFDGSLNAPEIFANGEADKIVNPHIYERADDEYDLGKLLAACDKTPDLYIAASTKSDSYAANAAFCQKAGIELSQSDAESDWPYWSHELAKYLSK